MSLPLSPRELEAIRHIANGLRPKEAAYLSGVRADTFGDYLERIRLKLGAKTTAQAMVIATRRGLV